MVTAAMMAAVPPDDETDPGLCPLVMMVTTFGIAEFDDEAPEVTDGPTVVFSFELAVVLAVVTVVAALVL